MLFSPPALAQAPAGPVAFAPVTGVPIPFQSVSGRFSSLNPIHRRTCMTGKVTGRVVSSRLIMVDQRFCGPGQSDNVLVNVEFSNPADAGQMIVGRRVTIAATFTSAEEDRNAVFYALYLIAPKAVLVSADPPGPPAPAFTSYMICQPPELDVLAGKLGHELCVQNTIVANLGVTGPALETAARAPTNVPMQDAASGDPNAITCQLDLERSDIHLPAIACARDSYWDWYKTKWRDYLFQTPAPP
jgi:hypothetical protein